MHKYANLVPHLKLLQRKRILIMGRILNIGEASMYFSPELLHIEFIDISYLVDNHRCVLFAGTIFLDGLTSLLVLEPRPTGRRTGAGDPNSDQLNAEN